MRLKSKIKISFGAVLKLVFPNVLFGAIITRFGFV